MRKLPSKEELKALIDKYPWLQYETLHVANPWMQMWKKLAYKIECLHAKLGVTTITDVKS